MGAPIFIVDPDRGFVHELRRLLDSEGFTAHAFSTAAELLEQTSQPSLFLLGRELPDMDGLDLCHEIRRSPLWADVPAMFVTDRGSEFDRVSGLQIADDYVIKPFSGAELVARVRALLRRTRRADLPSVLRVGDLELNSEIMAVNVQARSIPLTTMEFRLLACLASNLGKTFRREQLLSLVWDARFVTPRTVDVHVRRLREKIEPNPQFPSYIRTVRGKGYRLSVYARTAMPNLTDELDLNRRIPVVDLVTTSV